MKLHELTIKNFMPYKGIQKISFPTARQENVMLVFGDNMRGKTSFLNTIRWCFFGKALGRHLKLIPTFDLVNWDAAKEGDWKTYVHIRFENDGHEYDLRREIEPKPLIPKPKNSSDFDESLMLRKDGAVIEQHRIKHEINQIIPEDIARFFLFDGELLQEYEMLLDEEDTQGKNIKLAIEKVLGVPALINARTDLDNLLSKARKINAKDTQHIAGLEQHSQQLRMLQSDRETLDLDLEGLKKQQVANQTEIESLDQDLEKSRSVLAGKDRMDTLKSEASRLEQEQETLEQEKLEGLKDAWKDLIQSRLQAHLVALEEKRASFSKAQRERFSMEDRVNTLKSILQTSACPTCEQSISSEKRETFGGELGELEAEMARFKDERNAFDNLSEEIVKLSRVKASGAQDRIPRIDKELRRISIRLTEIDNETQELDLELRKHDTAEIARKRTKRDALLKHNGVLEDTIKERTGKIAENERKQEQLTSLIESNAVAREKKSTKLVHVYKQLREVFSESINALREDLRNAVADLATQAFAKLTTEPTYSGLKINESYGLTIVDREGRSVTQRSAGAEQIVALSLIDGLNRTARKTGPIIMDTPLGRLDLKHREKVLHYIPQMADQVILLVHEGELRKNEVIDSLKNWIGGIYSLERVSSSETRIVQE